MRRQPVGTLQGQRPGRGATMRLREPVPGTGLKLELSPQRGRTA